MRVSPTPGRAAARAALIGLVAAAAGGAGLAGAACSAFDEATTSSDAAIDTEAGATRDGAVSPDSGYCIPGGFCDSFDDDVALPRAWKLVKGSGAANVAVVKDAGLNGSGAFVVSITDDQTVQSGYLQLDSVPNGPEAYTMILSFSANVTTTGTGFLLGPRFNTDEGKLGEHDLIIDFHAGQTRLDHYAPLCDGGCATPNTDTPLSPGWHRFVLTVDVHGPDAGDYGSLSYLVDGASGGTAALSFSMSKPASYAFQVGITYSTGKAAGTVAFDDVSLVVKP